MTVIPEDADCVRASFEDGVLRIDWYRNPVDSPEWWGKDLGFCVRLAGGRDSYTDLVGELVRELAERAKVEPPVVSFARGDELAARINELATQAGL
jgi:hypothetical protein